MTIQQLMPGTTHFNIYYDDQIKANDMVDPVPLATFLRDTCEADFAALSLLFGRIMPPTEMVWNKWAFDYPFHVTLLSNKLTGFAGGIHYGSDIYCYVSMNTDNDGIRALAVAEVDEIFMSLQKGGYDPSTSKGEALSRVLPMAMKLSSDIGLRMSTGRAWMNATAPPAGVPNCTPGAAYPGVLRPDYVSATCNGDPTSTDPTKHGDTDWVPTGCGSLFLNYLHHQLHLSWANIVAAAGTLGPPTATLLDTATALGVKPGPTGTAKTVFGDFNELLARHYTVPLDPMMSFIDDQVFPILEGGSWADWQPIAFPSAPAFPKNHTLGDPALVAWAPDRMDAVAIGAPGDNTFWHLSWNAGWGTWENVPNPMGKLFINPAYLVSRAPNQLDVVAQANDGTLWHRPWSSGSWGPAWEDLSAPASFFSAPIVSSAPNQMDIVAFDGSTLRHRPWTSGTWGAWATLPLPPLAPGASLWPYHQVVAPGPGRLDVIVLDSNSNLWHAFWNGKWQPWEGPVAPPPSVTPSAPTLTARAPNQLDVFAVGSDYNLWHIGWNGSWTAPPWENLGQPSQLFSTGTVCSWSENRLDVFSLGVDTNVYHRAWNGSWGPWEPLGAPAGGVPREIFSLTSANMRANQIQLLVTNGSYDPLTATATTKGWGFKQYK